MDNQFEIAMAKIKKGESKKGIIILENIIKKDPNHLEALYQLGLCKSDMALFPESIAFLKRCIQIKPDWCQAYVDLGYSYTMNRESELAFQACEKAVKLNPNDFNALHSFGSCFLSEDTIDQAITLYNLANLSKPNQPSLFYSLALAYKKKNDLTSAKMWLERILEIDDKSGFKIIAKSTLAKMENDRYHIYDPNMRFVASFVSILEKLTSMDEDKIKEMVAELETKFEQELIITTDYENYHSLRTLKGRFSDLDLYCFLYAALKQIDPTNTFSSNLEREYEMALEMIKNQKK